MLGLVENLTTLVRLVLEKESEILDEHRVFAVRKTQYQKGFTGLKIFNRISGFTTASIEPQSTSVVDQ